MLDFRLHTFLTLCETMNYTQAAQKLCITQPAVTQHIHFLENHYGCKLFQYEGKTLRLTREGLRLRDLANSLAYNSRKIEKQLTASGPEALHIGATKTIGEYVIPPMVATFIREHPDCNLSLLVDNTHVLLQALDRGELDFALVEGFFDKQKYGHWLYRDEAFFGVCAPDHPLAGKPLSLKDLFTENIFVREHGSGTRAIFEQFLHSYNYTLQSFARITEISDFSIIKMLVQQRLGIAFLYEPVVKRELEQGELVRLQLKGPELFRELNFVFLNNNLFIDEWKKWIVGS